MDQPTTDTSAPTSMWSKPAVDQILVDEDCSPTKTCRNMVGISFEGFGDPGMDLQTAWRTTLQRDGKISDDGASIKDIVLGSPDA